MKRIINIAGGLFFFLFCNSQEKSTIQINKSIKDSFYFAKKLVDKDDLPIIDGHSAILVPERMGEEEEWLDTGAKHGFQMPCQCAYKNDTLLVYSGLAWEGGFGYTSKATKNESANFLFFFGKNRKWKFEGSEYNEEIWLPSNSDKLIISRAFPLKLDQLLYGYFEIDSGDFFEISGEEEDTIPQRHILKIFFSCKVFPEIL